MSLIDLLLNLAGLLAWLRLRLQQPGRRRSPFAVASPLVLRGGAKRIFLLLGGLAVFLLVRAVFYWHIGSRFHWTPTIVFGPVNLSFRSDLFLRILVFSILGFSVTVALFYHGVLFLVLAAGRGSGADLLPRWIRTQLSFLDRWPTAFKILLPFLVCAAAWMGLEPLVVSMELIPPPKSFRHLLEQSMVVGASSYFVWKYFAAALVLLHLLNTYIYIGSHSLLTFAHWTAQRLLRPLRWLPLRLGPVDFAPVVFLAALFLVVELANRGLAHLYARLPF